MKKNLNYVEKTKTYTKTTDCILNNVNINTAQKLIQNINKTLLR
jgi:hypothetical protein